MPTGPLNLRVNNFIVHFVQDTGVIWTFDSTYADDLWNHFEIPCNWLSYNMPF